MYGKSLRLSQIFNQESKKTCIVPLDHGTTIGPVIGINDYLTTIYEVLKGGANAIVLHKGLLKEVSKHPAITNGNYFMHLSVSTILSSDPSFKVLVGTVEEAIKLGAIGVSIHVNLATMNDSEMLKDLGNISKICMEWSMPLLAMMYVYKKNIEVFNIAHAARIAEELGADIIKVNCLNLIDEIDMIKNSINIPLIIAGGEKKEDPKEILYFINQAIKGGVDGIAIGRNIFQNENPKMFTEILTNFIHNKKTYEESLETLSLFDKHKK